MLRRIDVGEALELMGDEVHEGGLSMETDLPSIPWDSLLYQKYN